MDMNHDAREAMNRWRTRQKTAERRIINFTERVSLRMDAIRERMVTQREPLLEWEIREVYYRDVGVYQPIDTAWRAIRVGETWGGTDVSAFFKREITIPQSMDGQRVFLRIYVGGDSLLKLDGIPHHGLDPFRDTVLLMDSATGDSVHLIEMESYIFWYPAEGVHNIFRQAELVTIDADIEAAYWDYVAMYKALFMQNIDLNLKTYLETHLWDAIRDLPIHESHEVFKEYLSESRKRLRETVFGGNEHRTSGLLHMVGHSHLDIVYQWPHREYIRKVGRTHATMLRMIEQYPDFKFSQSSAKIYADMKEHYPHLFEQVRQCVADGSWQPVGAFWLEPDCNLISGESFVRHILHGQRFWQEEFGFTSRVCWQPDVFGMSWALPQILKRSGIDVVLTNKLYVWNDTNQWMQNDFWWEAPDGSRVMAVIPPGHFIGFVDPDHMDTYWKAFSDKDTVGETIYTYGWGDGGGGVDPEMIECAMRYQNFPGLVRSQFSHPEDTLLRIAELAQHEDLPVWRDELYLETHRGTYTSKGWLKKHNRQSEVMLQQVEAIAAFAWLNGQEYPEAKLDHAWKILLNTQFHDALPGTHITEVYHYLLDEYEALYGIARVVRAQAGPAIFGKHGDNLLIFNPSPQPRTGVVSFPANAMVEMDAPALPYQTVTNLNGTKSVLLHMVDAPLPSMGYTVLPLSASPEVSEETAVFVSENLLENAYLRAEFDPNGELISLWDKEAQREVIAENQRGNRFQLYEDRPGRYDAWDIVASYVEHELILSDTATLTVDEQGPLRASLRLVRAFYNSTITQRISLSAESRALTFETEVDWHERQRLLKVGFPVNINAHTATYDMAYGTIERATHRNTDHDRARFEVPAHWWMDVSEHDYGVALLNDSKYGHEANHEWMRLTLLKGSISPDPEADLGTHYFTYALYPHVGDWRDGKVIGAATALNVPLYVRKTALPPQTHTFITCDADNVSIEAVKRSEDGKRLIIRLVERYNQRTHTMLRFHKPITRVSMCDLMENEEAVLAHDGNTVEITLKPCEIATLALE